VKHPPFRRPSTFPEPFEKKVGVLPAGIILNPYEALCADRPAKTYQRFFGTPWKPTTLYPQGIKEQKVVDGGLKKGRGHGGEDQKAQMSQTTPGGWRPGGGSKEDELSQPGPAWVAASHTPRSFEPPGFVGGHDTMWDWNLKRRLNVRNEKGAEFRTGRPRENYITIPLSKSL